MTTPSDIIKIACDNRIALMHTCMPAQIVSFEYETSKAVVQPCLNKRLTATSGDIEVPAPIINNVPVIFPQTADFSMTYPIKKDDYCLLVFSERSLDLWKTQGGVVTPDDFRKFDFSDAIAIMGVNPFNVPSKADNDKDFLLQYKGSKIRIKDTGAVVIETASTIAIGTQITELLEVVSQILSYISNPIGVAVPSVPFTGPLADAATAAALKVQLDAIKGTIP